MTNDTGTDAGSFQKPDIGSNGSNERRFQSQPSPGAASSQVYTRSTYWLRPYEPAPRNGGTVWLDHGEYFAVDGALEVSGEQYQNTTSNTELITLVNFQPVPFHLTRVSEEGEWTNRSRFSDLSYGKTQDLQIHHPSPANFTLVIPPSSFGAKGVYDIRVVPLTDQQVPKNRELFTNFVVAFRLHYGSTQPTNMTELISERIKPTEVSRPFRRYLGPNSGLLLYPRSKGAQMATNMDWSQFDLNEVQTTSSDSMTLETTVVATSRRGVVQENAYVVLDGDEPIDTKLRRGETLPLTDYPNTPDAPYANRFEFDIQLDDDRLHVIRVLALPKPFCDWAKTSENSPYGRISNPIFVQNK